MTSTVTRVSRSEAGTGVVGRTGGPPVFLRWWELGQATSGRGMLGLGRDVARSVRRFSGYLKAAIALLPNPVPGQGLKCLTVGEELFFYTATGERLHCVWLPGAQKLPTILFFHGIGANLGHCVTQLRTIQAMGFGVLAVDYRGFGKSSGFPNGEAGLYSDGVAAFDFLVAGGLNPGSIIILGRSLGAAVAAAVARCRSCGGVILESPVSSLPDLYCSLKLPRFLLRSRFSLATSLLTRGISHPTLVLHGAQDRLAPRWMAEEIFCSLQCPKRLVVFPAVGHYGLHRHAQGPYIEAVEGFAATHFIESERI